MQTELVVLIIVATTIYKFVTASYTQPRYFLTYKKLHTSDIVTEDAMIGRFADMHSAKYWAEFHYCQLRHGSLAITQKEDHGEFISIRKESDKEYFSYLLKRLLIRILRIIFGLGIGFILVKYLVNNLYAYHFSDENFTIFLISIFSSVACSLTIGLALMAAFGESPESAANTK